VNPYAKTFIRNIPIETTLQTCNPICEVLEPSKYELRGSDKVGALMLFKNNRGWWTGSIMDEVDASSIFEHKFGPTVIQVAAGCFACFLWMMKNTNSGCHWPDTTDSQFIIDTAKPYLGKVYSGFIDLSKTHLKDCYKFEDFVTKKFDKEMIGNKKCF
jgi:homospermidine synthase